MLPLLVAKIFSPGVGATPEAPAAARKDLAGMGAMSRDEWITAVTFVVMVAGWVFGNALQLNGTAVAFMGFGVLLVAGVLTLDDIAKQGDTLATFLWLAVLFALSAQLNELGFMGYVGERLASRLGGLSWPVLYVTLIALYVGLHYFFVSQTSQVLALLGVFLDVGIRGGVPAPLMAPGLLFASSYFSVITPQGGSQNIIFVASGYLKQGELYKLGLLTTLAFMAVYLLIGTPWILFVIQLMVNMDYFVQALRNNPELAIFLTLAIGFLIGRVKFGSFSLGIVVGTLLAGVADRAARHQGPGRS